MYDAIDSTETHDISDRRLSKYEKAIGLDAGYEVGHA